MNHCGKGTRGSGEALFVIRESRARHGGLEAVTAEVLSRVVRGTRRPVRMPLLVSATLSPSPTLPQTSPDALGPSASSSHRIKVPHATTPFTAVIFTSEHHNEQFRRSVNAKVWVTGEPLDTFASVPLFSSSANATHTVDSCTLSAFKGVW